MKTILEVHIFDKGAVKIYTYTYTNMDAFEEVTNNPTSGLKNLPDIPIKTEHDWRNESNQ